MSNLAKDDDIFRMIDDCGEQSMLTVCSLIFFSFIYFKSAKFREEKRSRILGSFAKVYTSEKTEIYDSGKLIHAKKTSFFNSQKFIHYRKTPKLVITVLPVIHLFIKNV